MKPIIVKDLVDIVSGELMQDSVNEVVLHGAYRLKQVKYSNTALFISKRIVDWKKLEPFFPIILVTDCDYRQKDLPRDVIVIKVANTEEAYWKFVHYYRDQFKIPVVAITGTSGKTTTKEMIKHILSSEIKVSATNLSSNSRTAFLQYLLNIEDETEAAIIETAVGSPGDVSNAGKYFKPTIGIITNIGEHHLNYCKTLEGYIEAKGEMLQIIDPMGTLIINTEDVNTSKIDMTNFSGRIIRIGQHASCNFRASNIRFSLNGMKFTLHHNMKKYDLFVPGFGEHQVYNALAAIAAVYEMGITIPKAAVQLLSFKQLKKHLQLFEGINDSILIDDTWSITTTSLKAALEVLNELGKNKKKVAVIGTITDLGSYGYIIHERAGELIVDIGVDVLITVGKHASIMADHVVALGMDVPVYKFNNSINVYQLLKDIVDANTILLIKGDMYTKALHELAKQLKSSPLSSE
ncbi:UDP-N-acetylmuramoyl-tripeptide--D-alanyl-D-alanine ligase [Lysinibacillus sp. FJAT-14745]|uniref:Mur ligase family protein n=1 Tax=Lysinibacillus sp. FJAT-14745 TaxID=1704289 RepID=UPI0006ABD270|nr:UDP-N-acetylmuramoyl-tripeptide--D-alanyl-D-alanine ligase [Lysinibacillus sp. FJAT-14745]KOP80849.1 UDP-N-acetylmuramoyl-tripeptide--D-alanyl-D-alanine ligase [Lysinibacillus sp. FJAT-14745]